MWDEKIELISCINSLVKAQGVAEQWTQDIVGSSNNSETLNQDLEEISVTYRGNIIWNH